MKQNIFKSLIFAATALAMFVGCAEGITDGEMPEPLVDPNQGNQGVAGSAIVLSLNDLPLTKATVSDATDFLTLKWGGDEVVTLYDESGARVDDFKFDYDIKEEADAQQDAAVFAPISETTELAEGAKYNVVFPKSDEATFAEAIKATDLSTQIQVGNSPAHLLDMCKMSAEITFDSKTNPTNALKCDVAIIKVVYPIAGFEGDVPEVVTLKNGADTYTLTMSGVEVDKVYTSYFAVKPISSTDSRQTKVDVDTNNSNNKQVYSANLTNVIEVGKLYSLAGELPEIPLTLSVKPASIMVGSMEYTHEWTDGDKVIVSDKESATTVGNFEYNATEGCFEPETEFTLTDGVTYQATFAATNSDVSELTQTGADLDHLGGVMNMLGEFEYSESTYIEPVENSVEMKYDKAILTYLFESDAVPTKVVFEDGEEEYTLNVNGVVAVDNIYSLYYAIRPSDGSRTLTFTAGEDIYSKDITSAFEANNSYSESNSGFEPPVAPELIGTAAELIAFAAKVNGGDTKINAELTASINMSGQDFVPIGNADNEFAGIFDGKGYTISNITVSDPLENNIGLIGSADGATIKNVTVENPNIEAFINAGGIAGHVSDCAIENCHVTGTGTIKGKSYVGGVIGHVEVGTNIVKGCSNQGVSVVGTGGGATTTEINKNSVEFSRTGGVIGSLNKGVTTVEDCYNEGAVTGTGRVGGIAGFAYGINNTHIEIIACYNKGSISGVKDEGGIVGYVSSSHANSVINITACYNNGSVSADTAGAGGIVSYVLAKSSATPVNIKGCYTNTTPSATESMGGIVALEKAAGHVNITASYYNGVEQPGVGGTYENETITQKAVNAMNAALVGSGYQYTGTIAPTLVAE